MEVVQGMMAELHKKNAENVAALAKHQFDAFQSLVQETKTTTGMTDTRGIGRPVPFKGDEGKCGEWKAKLSAYLRVAVPNSDSWIQWCGKQQMAILESDIDVEFGNDAFIVKEFAVMFYSILLRVHGGRRFPDLPQRQGRERVGSHEAVEGTVRAEDSWHEKGCAEGDDQ